MKIYFTLLLLLLFFLYKIILNVSDITVRTIVSIYNKNYTKLTSKTFEFVDNY